MDGTRVEVGEDDESSHPSISRTLRFCIWRIVVRYPPYPLCPTDCSALSIGPVFSRHKTLQSSSPPFLRCMRTNHVSNSSWCPIVINTFTRCPDLSSPFCIQNSSIGVSGWKRSFSRTFIGFLWWKIGCRNKFSPFALSQKVFNSFWRVWSLINWGLESLDSDTCTISPVPSPPC